MLLHTPLNPWGEYVNGVSFPGTVRSFASVLQAWLFPGLESRVHGKKTTSTSFFLILGAFDVRGSAQTNRRMIVKYRESDVKAQLWNSCRDTLMLHANLSVQSPWSRIIHLSLRRVPVKMFFEVLSLCKQIFFIRKAQL